MPPPGGIPTTAYPYANPAPGGIEGRTDQGVDWSNIRGNIGAVASGVITNVYQKLSGFGTTVIEKVKGQYIYYGLETGGGAPVVTPGQAVQQGQAIAPGLGTGGIEVGIWNPATGRAAGAPQYTREGVATPSGLAFRAQIGNGITRTPATPTPNNPITRPGGGPANSPAGNASGIKGLLQGYTSLRDMSRTAPPGTKDPVKWFLASFTGQWDALAAGNSSSSAGAVAAPSVVGKVTRAMLVQVGSAYGWSGSEIDDWMNVISKESGGNPNAVNKQTGAFGVGQMLASSGSPSNLAPNMAKYKAYGGSAGSVLGQLMGMAGYIQQTYGTPSKAWAHEQNNDWY